MPTPTPTTSHGDGVSANQVASVGYAYDVALCLDITSDMQVFVQPFAAIASEFGARLDLEMERQNKKMDRLRIRMVTFGDLGADGPDAITTTPFFDLANDQGMFAEHVAGLRCKGGGDAPESALEALVVAIRSPWNRDHPRRRHVIVLCTDAPAHPAHPLGTYPMPEAGRTPTTPMSLDDLMKVWGDEVDEGEMDYAAKRLIIFAPKAYPWNEFNSRFENCVWVEVEALAGLVDVRPDQLFAALAGSV